ncbi:MAG: 16S rRNA (uracil(1498)-N(3))-methyltransferase [Bacteroidetes bacterium]|nr:16S rRNA (uracil(1498)-N(3))-methyltransferase [Bacteroidota bacterium]
MRVFILPPSFSGTKEFQLDNKDSHYLTRVLRLHTGSLFPGRDRQGNDWDLLISEVSKNSVILTCAPAADKHLQTQTPSISLFQCICKGKKMDQIVRQSTEIGVNDITPVISRYSLSNAGSSAQISQQKLQRWEIIIKEALQQSGSPVLTELHKPRSFDKMLEIVENGYMCLFFHQEIISSSTMAETLLTYKEEEKRLPLAVIIGPEGGFSEDEVDKMRKTGLKPVFLNTNILRAETAAIYALAAVQTLLSD